MCEKAQKRDTKNSDRDSETWWGEKNDDLPEERTQKIL